MRNGAHYPTEREPITAEINIKYEASPRRGDDADDADDDDRGSR